MLISSKYRFVFLANHKAASTSIEEMLMPVCEDISSPTTWKKHTNFREFENTVKPQLVEKTGISDWTSIAIMREPLSWLYSWYRFRSRKELHRTRHENSTFGLTFESFIKAYLSKDPPPYARISSQFDFVKSSQNKVGVDLLFLYESLNEFVQYMDNTINSGSNLNLKHLNRSPSRGLNSGLFNAALTYGLGVKNKLIKVTRLSHAPIRMGVTDNISNELYAALQKALAQDYCLYDHIANARDLTGSNL